ncbi:MAG TPA: CBS domain-containing protein [Steroidobacteraceae bacterium]|jgi:CBS domain-containing protein|nr:CBS domain-containing protein [Steroidobacteraceae bacterium]
MTQCREIMKRDIECLSPREPAQAAAERMRDRNIGFLPVCDDSMQVLGTVTDRDIALRIVADLLSAGTPVERVMTREVVACYPEDDIELAKELMADHRKSRIMCVDDDGTLIGVISLSDIAKLEGDGAARTLRAVSRREARH